MSCWPQIWSVVSSVTSATSESSRVICVVSPRRARGGSRKFIETVLRPHGIGGLFHGGFPGGRFHGADRGSFPRNTRKSAKRSFLFRVVSRVSRITILR